MEKEDEIKIMVILPAIFEKLVELVGEIKGNNYMWSCLFIGRGGHEEFDCKSKIIELNIIINRRIEKDKK